MKIPSPEVLRTYPRPNYVNPETRGPALIIVNTVFLAIATILLVLRLYTRIFVKKGFGIDDVFIIFAFLATVGVNVLVDIGHHDYGWNRHLWDIPISLALTSLKIAYATKLLFLCAGLFTALSLLAFYYRLARDSCIKWFRWSLHAAVVFNIVSWLPFFFVQIFVCTPIHAYWSLPEPIGTKCVDEASVTMAGGAMKVFVDFLITTLPIPLIVHLKMQKRQKYGIIVLLALGYLVTAAGAVRTYYAWKVLYGTNDRTWWQNPAFIASAIENDVAIICACIPTLRPLLPHLLGGPIGVFTQRVKGWTTRSNKSSPEATSDEARLTLEDDKSMATLKPVQIGGQKKLVIHTSQSYELHGNMPDESSVDHREKYRGIG